MWWIAWPLTFYCVCFTWIFFRAGDLDRAGPALRSFVLFSSNGVEQSRRVEVVGCSRPRRHPLDEFSRDIRALVAARA